MVLLKIPIDPQFFPEQREVYIVGGTTRDLLLGRTPVDYDIAVSQNPELFAEMTAARNSGRLIRMGGPGKRCFRVVAGGMVVDISGLKGHAIAHDLAQRDVTINAMAIALASGALVDPVGGQRDLAEGRIRMVSGHAFRQDPIRLLRVFRLAAMFEFSIEDRTLAAIGRDAALIRGPAGERICSELQKLFCCPASFPQVLGMADTGLLTGIFPELLPLGDRPDLLAHTLAAYGRLETLLNDPPPGVPAPETDAASPAHESQMPWLKCAILLHHAGMPPAPGHDAIETGGGTRAAETAAAACRRLRFPVRAQRIVTGVLMHHRWPRLLHTQSAGKPPATEAMTRFFMAGNSLTPHLVLHALADTGAETPDGGDSRSGFPGFAGALLQSYYGTYLKRKARPPLVTGRDLAAIFGLTPSPRFKDILEKLETARLSGRLRDRSAALAEAEKLIQASGENEAAAPAIRA